MNIYPPSALISIAEKYLNDKIEQAQPLTQGDVSETFHIITKNKKNYVIKNGASPQSEGKMLKFLASNGIDVPKVILANSEILILERIKETNSFSLETWSNLGKMLTKLHNIHNSNYGWEYNYAFGTINVINTPSSSWVKFWGEWRLACYLSHLPVTTAKKIENLIIKLDDFLPDHPIASLLHGDLWTGNILAHYNQPYLIDPACYYGHNEVDIAMLNLFGNPYDIFYQSYNLLEKGWQKRLAIYQIFPLIIHYILFGNYYLRMLNKILNDLKI